MASSMTNRLLQCCSCGQDLNLDSHTLACLCSVCNTCMEENISTNVETQSNIGKCPKCREVFYVEESDLLPFLATELKRRLPLECRSCSEENTVSSGKLWCQECKQIFCNSCNRVHMKLAKSHNCKDLDGMSGSEWIEQVMDEKCFHHGKECDFFCDQCNTCFCDVCYGGGECPSRDSGCVSARLLNVKDEVVKQKTEEGPILEEEVKKFATVVKESNEKLMRRSGELNAEFDEKCLEIWQNYDEKVDCARRDADELCNKLRSEKNDEEVQLRDQLAGNASLLSQIEMWLLSCQHLLHEAERNVDILCGLRTLKQRVQSWQEKWNRSDEIKLTDSSSLLNQNVNLSSSSPSLDQKESSSSLDQEEFSRSLDQEEIPILMGLKQLETYDLENGLRIQSIHVTEDGHIFLCSSGNRLIELSGNGEFLHEFHLKNENDENPQFLNPFYVCSISPNILVVCGEKEEIYFSERIKVRPFLKTKKIIKMKGKIFQSLCSNNDSVFVLHPDLTISCFNKNGEEIKTIKLQTIWSYSCDSMMRIDPVSGNFWVSKCVRVVKSDKWSEGHNDYGIVCFNSEGEKNSFIKEKKNLYDFYLNKYGHILYLNDTGIHSLSPEIDFLTENSNKPYKFFVFENKVFVPIYRYQMTSLEIFEILYKHCETL